MTWDAFPKILLGYAVFDVIVVVMAFGSGWALRRFMLVRLDPPGAFRGPSRGRQIAFGAALAAALVFAVVLPGWLASDFGSGEPYGYANPSSSGKAGLVWATIGLQSLFEELLFRAVCQALLALVAFVLAWRFAAGTGRRGDPHGRDALVWKRRAWFVTGTAANVVISIVFGLLHGSNPNVTGLAVLNIMFAGLTLGQLYWYQKSVWGAWGLHWVWNAGLLTLGLPVSGLAIGPPLFGFGFTRARDSVWTGGSFGPEGSLASTLVLGATFAALLVLCVREARREPPLPPEVFEAAGPPYQPQV